MGKRIALAVLLAACADQGAPPTPSPPRDVAPGLGAVRATQARFAAAGLVAASVAEDGTARLVRAPASAPPSAVRGEVAARAHLATLAPAFAAQADDVSRLHLVRESDRGAGGALVVLRPAHDGIDVYREDVRVLVRPDGGLVAIAGAPSPARPVDAHRRTATSALERALGAPAGAGRVLGERGGTRRVEVVAGPVRLSEPAWVRPVWSRREGALVAAWRVEYYAAGQGADAEAWRLVVADADGAVLAREDLRHDADVTFRVWAEPGTARPLDGPLADGTPHPIGAPGAIALPFVGPALITIPSGLNTNPASGADPWLPEAATESVGNNVDAYADAVAPDGFGDGDQRATMTSPGTFDAAYDPSAAPLASSAQTQAAVASLFYTINWLHDWYYDAGFDEAAGNGQLDNYGRGGQDGDPIRGEAQDAFADGARNNANMATPSDGASPRMQMYVWSGQLTSSLAVDPLGVTPNVGVAAFGPTDFDVTGDLVVAIDGGEVTTDGCEPITNNVAGKVALIDRGICTFKLKTKHATEAGAIGVVIANNRVDGGVVTMADGDPPGPATIPILSVSTADGAALHAALAAGAQTARLFRNTGTERDSSLDATIVAHEFGHFLHHRLADCASRQCRAISEGLGDFLALHLTLREGDDLAGAFPIAQYSTIAYPDAEYFGIRRAPYSTTPTRNAFSLGDIAADAELPETAPLSPRTGSDPSQVHPAGEIWASMLHEAYVALLATTQGPGATRSFDEVRRQMSAYLVTALGLLPVDATYTETRDALFAAVGATSPGDLAIVAEAFARRGAGTCAVAPPRASLDLTGVTESFVVTPAISVQGTSLELMADACDDDAYLDAGEAGTLTFTLGNGGPVEATGATFEVTAATPGITVEGGVYALPALPAFATTTVAVPVRADATLAADAILAVTTTVRDAEACLAERILIDGRAVGVDVEAGATDDVELPTTPWALAGNGAVAVWARAETAPGAHAWRGAAMPFSTDVSLVSPPLTVAAGAPLTLSMSYRHDLEVDAENVAFDGLVIEGSIDDGASWVDVGSLSGASAPAYPGSVGAGTSGALAGRAAFVGRNPSWPARDSVSVNLGGDLAGQTLRLRFRLATDGGVGGFGVELDDVTVTGVEGAPFEALVAEPGGCPPRADAGVDQQVTAGDVVVLDARGSSDPDDLTLAYRWRQVDGAGVELATPEAPIATFLAPPVTAPTLLSFEVEVSANGLADTATTRIEVLPGPVDPGVEPSDEVTIGGGACDGGASGATPLVWLWWLARRRRRARAR